MVFISFKFESEKYVTNVIEGGPWNAGQPLFLERWKEGMTLEKCNHKEAPIWVKFRNLPTEFWTPEGLSTVASAVRRPLYPDAFTSTMERIDYERVCIIVDVDAKFKDHVFMLFPSPNGEYNGSCKINIEYEWRLIICSSCKSFGHTDGDCPIAKKVVLRPKVVQIYVPKPQVEEQWKEQKRAKNVEVTNRDSHVTNNKERQGMTTTSPNASMEIEDMIDGNAFALLQNLKTEETNEEVIGNLESRRGPMQAAPTNGVK